jgi:hypothetical protein
MFLPLKSIPSKSIYLPPFSGFLRGHSLSTTFDFSKDNRIDTDTSIGGTMQDGQKKTL